MSSFIWQVVLVTCLSNFVYCGTVSIRNGITEQGNAISCPARNFREPLYFPHPTDCQKYYICDEGFPFLRQCQSGLHFNPSLKACDYPEDAGCRKEKPRGRLVEDDDLDGCPKKNSKDPVLFPHPTDCNKFYICDSGTPHLQTCQSGLHFNPKLKACDYPNNAGCAEVVSEEPKGKLVEDDDLDGCPKKNSKEPVLFPHPTDCNKFYICDSGTPHLQTCQSGLHFNPKIKACDYPNNAGCAEEKPRGKMIEDDDLDGCPKKNSKYPIFFPHPTDCNKFYICDSGVPHLQSCQSGLHFNLKIKACDYPEKAGCDEGFTVKPKGRMIGDDLDVCPVENFPFPVFIRHPSDCRKFYICDSGSAHLQTCQSGLHFNHKLKACDYPEDAGCDEGASVKPKGNFQDENQLVSCPIKSPADKPVLLPHPKECDKFFMCDNGKPYLKECQPGLNFNTKLQACDYAEKSICYKEQNTMKAGIPSPYCPSVNGKTLIFFRHPSNCSVYYMCSHGLAYKFVCPVRLHFNLRDKVCDYENKARCVINP